MPFLEALTAAGARGMLGYKYRVVTHRGLFAVVWEICRGESFIYKIPSVIQNYFEPFGI
jgi:hypothetical protein